jgi:hypothetical protein
MFPSDDQFYRMHEYEWQGPHDPAIDALSLPDVYKRLHESWRTLMDHLSPDYGFHNLYRNASADQDIPKDLDRLPSAFFKAEDPALATFSTMAQIYQRAFGLHHNGGVLRLLTEYRDRTFHILAQRGGDIRNTFQRLQFKDYEDIIPLILSEFEFRRSDDAIRHYATLPHPSHETPTDDLKREKELCAKAFTAASDRNRMFANCIDRQIKREKEDALRKHGKDEHWKREIEVYYSWVRMALMHQLDVAGKADHNCLAARDKAINKGLGLRNRARREIKRLSGSGSRSKEGTPSGK